jgi:hypothetical protein
MRAHLHIRGKFNVNSVKHAVARSRHALSRLLGSAPSGDPLFYI